MKGASERVRVTRNPLWRSGDKGKPWFVACDWCAGGNDGFLAQMTLVLGGPGRLGWAPDWQTAQSFAQGHALRHEQTRCQTCLHVPTEPISTMTEGSAG